MGNKPFSIGVVIDEGTPCQAGETVSGKVYFAVRKPQEVKDFTGIHLQIVGVEHAELGYSMTSRETEKSVFNILQVDFALVRLSDVRKGNYEYPFRWTVPATIPGAIKCTDPNNKRTFCEIRYILTAYLATSGMAVVPENRQLVSTVSLPIIGASPTTRPEPKTMPTEVFSMSSLCLPMCGRGSIDVGWKVDRPMASPGEEIKLQCWGDNSSRKEVDYVSARWVESVTWRMGPNLCHAKGTTRTLAEQKLRVATLAKWQPVLFPGRNNRRDLSATAADEPLTFTLKLPDDARDSYTGRLLQIRHLLIVTVHTPAFQTISPKMACPVEVVRPLIKASSSSTPTGGTSAVALQVDNGNLPVVQGQVLPDNWQAVTSEVVTIPEATAVVVLTDEPVAPTDVVAKVDTPVPPEMMANSLVINNASAATVDVRAMASAPDEALLYGNGDPEPEPDLSRLRDMAVNHPGMLSHALNQDPRWIGVVQDFTPREYSSFVLLARSHGPPVARSLAVCMGDKFECRHILACLWSLPDSNRMQVLREIAPLASDFAEGRWNIEKELSASERADFCAAIPAS